MTLRNPAALEDYIGSWLEGVIGNARASGGAVGLSGGIDSAVVAGLLRRRMGRHGCVGVMMPCHSAACDEQDAICVAQALDMDTIKVDLSGTYDALVRAMGLISLTDMAAANIKPRLRMTTLYAVSQSRGFIVCGTSNKAELTYGYFTKHGDSGADALPLADLAKAEVRALAAHIGVPEHIIKKPPTAGLWAGQTDEDEMGVSYDDLDAYVLSLPVGEPSLSKIAAAERASAHKRAMAPIPRPPAG